MKFFKEYQCYKIIKKSFPILFVLLAILFYSNLAVSAQTDDTKVEPSTLQESVPFSITSTIKHKHTGGSSGGGCYGKLCTGVRRNETNCGGTMVYYPATDSTGCDRCGAGYHGDQSGRECWTVTVSEESYSYYDLSCGRSTADTVGTLTLTKSTQDWTKTLDLIASYENLLQMKISESPYIFNGVPNTENTISVSENGIYTLQLNADENCDTNNAMISMDIRNIDHTAPEMKSYTLLPEEWTNQGVLFTSEEVVDLQSDQTNGCGLHELTFSYDEGATWCNESTNHYDKNGTYTVKVRDWLENTRDTTFTINNIDCMGPTIE